LKRRELLAWFWGAIVCALACHSVYLTASGRLAADSDILALLPVPERDPALQKAVLQSVAATQQRLIVLVGAEDWRQARSAADAYLAALRPHKELLRPEERLSQWQQDETFFRKHQLTLLTAADEQALRNEPKDYWIDVALAKLYSPFQGLKTSAWHDDPFGLFAGWLQGRAGETPVRPRDGRLYVGDGQLEYVVLPFTLGAAPFSMSTQAALIPLLERARQAARRAAPQGEIMAAGVVLFAAAAGAQAKWEVSTIGAGSLLGIVCLIWLTFQSLKPIVWITLSIGIGCLGALSLSWLLFERLHLLTLVFGASLIGGAQDYGSYFLCNRLAREREAVDSWQLLRLLLPALVLALVTTVVGYLALAFTPFPGLRQMAVFSALGLVFAWLTVVCWFPALVRDGGARKTPAVKWLTAALTRRSSWRSGRVRPWAGGLVAVVALFGLSRLGVQDDIRLLQNAPRDLLDDQLKISRLLAAPAPAQFYMVRGRTIEELLQREEALARRLEPLVEKQVVGGYQAVSTWAPSVRAQTARRSLIEATLLSENGALEQLGRRIGADDHWVSGARERLLAAASPLSVDDLLKSAAGESIRHLWLGPVGGAYASIVALRGISDANLPILQQIAGGLDGVQWVDTVAEISSVLARYRKYMAGVIALSYLAVYALLYWRYGAAAWRVLAPIALASAVTLALFGIADQKLNLFHVLALMLLLGVGVDYGIFFKDHPGRSDPVGWLAVGLSAFSTLLSFGLLSLSKTPALQAFGITMTIGTIAVCLIVPCFGYGKGGAGEDSAPGVP
jgi:predicted exporter